MASRLGAASCSYCALENKGEEKSGTRDYCWLQHGLIKGLHRNWVSVLIMIFDNNGCCSHFEPETIPVGLMND